MEQIDIIFTHLANLGNPHTGEIINYDSAYDFIENAKLAIAMISDVNDIVKPSTILEIGFNRGSSALLFLQLTEANLYSIDVVLNKKSTDYLSSVYGNRFVFKQANSRNLNISEFTDLDLVFIDGDHSYEGMFADTQTAIDTGAKYILFDDYEHPIHGDDLKHIIPTFSQLEIIKTYFNQCLCKVTI